MLNLAFSIKELLHCCVRLDNGHLMPHIIPSWRYCADQQPNWAWIWIKMWQT